MARPLTSLPAAAVTVLIAAALIAPAGAQQATGTTAPVTTIPRSAGEGRQTAVPGATPILLVAYLTDDGQRIDHGLAWRVFEDRTGPDGRNRLLSTHKDPSPTVQLQPGDYLVNAAFGRAHLTRRISVKAGVPETEKFVLNAGGLRIAARLKSGEAAPANSVVYEVFSDERDQFANRTRIVGGLRPGVIVRLNSGIYHVVSTLGDANATVRADVTVEAGKLTEAVVLHAMARVTFKLVTRAGGEALADTQWSIATPQGEVVKETAGALPTHTLLPGSYVVTARSGGQTFRREFAVRTGDVAQVEVVIQ